MYAVWRMTDRRTALWWFWMNIYWLAKKDLSWTVICDSRHAVMMSPRNFCVTYQNLSINIAKRENSVSIWKLADCRMLGDLANRLFEQLMTGVLKNSQTRDRLQIAEALVRLVETCRPLLRRIALDLLVLKGTFTPRQPSSTSVWL